MYGLLKHRHGSVPRAVASGLQVELRSLPLAALIRRAFPYLQLQIALKSAPLSMALFQPFEEIDRVVRRAVDADQLPAFRAELIEVALEREVFMVE
jgi:hypothetical protein